VAHYDQVETLAPYRELPDVLDVRKTHFEEHPDGRQDIELTYCAHGQIPKIAQKLISPGMITWKEVGRWDPAEMSYHFEIIPFFLRNFFMCRGKWVYQQKNDRVVLSLEGQLHFKFPVIGPIVEQAIAREFYRNQDFLYRENLRRLRDTAQCEQ